MHAANIDSIRRLDYNSSHFTRNFTFPHQQSSGSDAPPPPTTLPLAKGPKPEHLRVGSNRGGGDGGARIFTL